MNRVIDFVKKEIVLIISFVLAIISMFLFHLVKGILTILTGEH